MDYSKLRGYFFLNNKYIKASKANIHILNHSLHFSGSVFEGIRVYNGIPFLLGKHLKRLLCSCDLMKLHINLSIDEISRIIFTLIKKNKIRDGYIRPIIFRDSKSMSPDISGCESQIFIAIWNWKLLFKDKPKISLTVGKLKKMDQRFFPVKAKTSGSYQGSIIEKYNATLKGFDDALMLDSNNNIAETTACNIFWYKNKKVFTPKTHSILNGITRQIVMKILKKNKIECIVGNFKRSHIMNADEVFITGTASEVVGISKIDEKKYTKNDIVIFLKDEFDKLKNLS